LNKPTTAPVIAANPVLSAVVSAGVVAEVASNPVPSSLSSGSSVNWVCTVGGRT
jgi:hypothetical protein